MFVAVANGFDQFLFVPGDAVAHAETVSTDTNSRNDAPEKWVDVPLWDCAIVDASQPIGTPLLEWIDANVVDVYGSFE